MIDQGVLKGIDAVIDKDRAASVMARDIEAQLLIILTSVNKVSLNYSKPDQQELDQITLAEAERYLAEGHFPPGSMGPKIEAAIEFLKAGGEKVIIGSIDQVRETIYANAGTTIIP